MSRTKNLHKIKPANPCEMGISMAWMSSWGEMYWLHGDQHFKFASKKLCELGVSEEPWAEDDDNKALILADRWIKISNYRDIAMQVYDEERHIEANEDDDYPEQLARLAEYIVNCVIYHGDDPNKPIITLVYVDWFDPDERVTMTPHDVVEKFGGPKYGNQLLDKMYDGLMNQMKKRNPKTRGNSPDKSHLGSLLLVFGLGYSLTKRNRR